MLHDRLVELAQSLFRQIRVHRQATLTSLERPDNCYVSIPSGCIKPKNPDSRPWRRGAAATLEQDF